MKVFVAGASGALGPPAVKALVAAGHEVVAMTRRPGKQGRLEELGAKPVVGDALDAPGLKAVVSAAGPEVVVDLLTALPPGGPRRVADLEPTNRVRTEGARNLVAAARDAGARRYVAESFFLVYGYGDHGPKPLEEDAHMPEPDPDPAFQRPVDALRLKERTVLESGLEAVVLRFAAFYGLGAGTADLAEQLRRRRLPVVRSDSVSPWVHLDDAAAAVAAAVDRGRPGAVYNVADDEPLPLGTVLTTLAAYAGAPRPFAVPKFVVGLMYPYLVKLFIDSAYRLDNSRAKRELGWNPAYPTVGEGLRTVVGPRP